MALFIVVLAGMLLLTLVRRAAGGMVMSVDRVFFPYTGVLVLGIACQLALLAVIRSANRRDVRLPGWLWRAGAMFDLGIAAALLSISQFYSPRGPIAALSSPPLLLLPLVLLMSVLRLRTAFTLYAGLTAAAIHILLTLRAINVSGAPHEAYPVYLAYGFILLLTAIVAAFVTRELRRHVREAADEAAAHERSDRMVDGMQRDLSVARDIQRGLLPSGPPRLAGFDIAGMNRPAEQTGGDYFDWQTLPDGRLAVALADVSGHGIGPALVMAVCRAYARASAPMTHDPAALLARLNELLHADLPSDRFITFALAVLDKDGGVQLISAGHGPTLLYRPATGEAREFGGDGMPLGVSPAEQYGPTTSLNLLEGDILVMLTDGFFEWARPGDGQQFGIPRLHQAIRDSADGDAAAILRGIDETVCTFCRGTPQSDDMTAIVIKRAATSSPAKADPPIAGGRRDQAEPLPSLVGSAPA